MATKTAVAQRGLSLIELMVAIAAGLLVLAIALNMLVSTLGSNTSTLRYARFNQDLRGMLSAVTRDLERAGTWARAADALRIGSEFDLQFSAPSGNGVTVTALRTGTNTTDNAFAAPFTSASLVGRTIVIVVPIVDADGSSVKTRFNFTVTAYNDANQLTGNLLADPDNEETGAPFDELPAPALVLSRRWTILNPFGLLEVVDSDNADDDPSCIRYSYDLDLDGVVDANEFFGFRYDAPNRAIDGRTSNGTCAGNTGWETVTDNRMVELTQFQITTVASGGEKNELNVELREFLVRIDGNLNAEDGVERSVQAAVKVRNNRVN